MGLFCRAPRGEDRYAVARRVQGSRFGPHSGPAAVPAGQGRYLTTTVSIDGSILVTTRVLYAAW